MRELPEIPAADRATDTDYAWFAVDGSRDPVKTGWMSVNIGEMPHMPSDHPAVIMCREMRLYQRPLVITERVRAGEHAVAIAAVAAAGRGRPQDAPQVARAITSPLGPMPVWWTLRGWWIYLMIRWNLWRGKPVARWVKRALKTDDVGLRRWADENSMPVPMYVQEHVKALIEGRGRWPGQLVVGMRR